VKALVDAHAEGEDEAAAKMEIDEASQKTSSRSCRFLVHYLRLWHVVTPAAFTTKENSMIRILICFTLAVALLLSAFTPLQAASPHHLCWHHHHHH
jgi:hypothetical protein